MKPFPSFLFSVKANVFLRHQHDNIFGTQARGTHESKNDEGRDFIIANISPMTIFGENKTMMVNGNAMITVITNDVTA